MHDGVFEALLEVMNKLADPNGVYKKQEAAPPSDAEDMKQQTKDLLDKLIQPNKAQEPESITMLTVLVKLLDRSLGGSPHTAPSNPPTA